jgi:hypothetical protein
MELAQTFSTLIFGAWSYIAVLIVTAVPIALAARRRRRTSRAMRVEDVKIIFQDKPYVEEPPPRKSAPKRKTCYSCGAEVPFEALICGKCEMPVMYRK